MLPTKLKMLHYTKRWHESVATKTRCILFRLTTLSIYTLFKYQLIGKIVVKGGQTFDNVQWAVHFKHQNRGVDRMPSIAKKRLLRKKYNKQLLSCFQQTKLTQTTCSVFAYRTEQVEKTKFEFEMKKNEKCFLFALGNYTSGLVFFKIKLLYINHFRNSKAKAICINQLVLQMI